MRPSIGVLPTDPHAITGPRSRVEDHFRAEGIALWLRANGSATLFYRDNGRRRQVSWRRFYMIRPQVSAQ